MQRDADVMENSPNGIGIDFDRCRPPYCFPELNEVSDRVGHDFGRTFGRDGLTGSPSFLYPLSILPLALGWGHGPVPSFGGRPFRLSMSTRFVTHIAVTKQVPA